MTIRVLLVDDQTVVRVGFRALLELTDDIVVVGEGATGREAIDLVQRLRPDVVLMDIRMPVLDGLEATRRIVADRELDGVRVLLLTTYEIDEYVFEGLRVGASGFLLKDVEAANLHAAVRVIAAGQSLLDPAVTRRVIEEFSRRDRPAVIAPERLNRLTEREREVLASVAAGLSNDEIASELLMSPLTAKTHVSRAMTKLRARDRAQLVLIAFETGLVQVGMRARPGRDRRG